MGPAGASCGIWPGGGVPATRRTTAQQPSGAMPDAIPWADQGPESGARSIGGGATGVDWRCRRPQEVFKAGTGMAVSHVVTRRNSALTGHDVGRCRRIRSLYGLIWVATLHRVRITVPGWAVARAVWASVWVRRAWWRTYAAHDNRSRVALARNVVAEVRSLWRSPLTALIALSPFPRAQERSSYTCWGVGASQAGIFWG